MGRPCAMDRQWSVASALCHGDTMVHGQSWRAQLGASGIPGVRLRTGHMRNKSLSVFLPYIGRMSHADRAQLADHRGQIDPICIVLETIELVVKYYWYRY